MLFIPDRSEWLMQTQDDDFPYASDDPSLAPADEENPALSLTPQQVGDLKASLRLVVGSALNGRDAYILRLRKMQAMQETVKPEIINVDENETFRDQLRYLLLGMLFETPDLVQRGLVHAEHVSDKVFGLFSKILSPFTGSWIFSPVRNQVDQAAARGEKVIDRLIREGRMEERNSRLIIQQKAIDDLINDFLEYVILKTEATQIIEAGGLGMAGGMVDEFQEQSAAVDSILEQKLKSFFMKPTPPHPVPPPSDPAEGR
jgi:hypothetical protein